MNGANVNKLIEVCQKLNCELLARRVELIEGNMRFRPDFKVDQSEILLLTVEFKDADGRVMHGLR